MMGLTLDVVGRALFGQGIDGATTEVVGESMTELLDAGGAFFRIAPIARAINDRTRVEFEDVFRCVGATGSAWSTTRPSWTGSCTGSSTRGCLPAAPIPGRPALTAAGRTR